MLRPEDIKKRAEEADKPLIDRGEQYIDDELSRKWQPGQTVEIGLSQVYSSRVANHLVDMYRQCGWQVSITADTREGGFVLSFKKMVVGGNAADYYDK